MALLIVFVYFCNIPNPNMILIAGLVLCSALFSFGGGVTAGIIMFFYTLFFFSTDNSFINFTSQNLQKVFVSFVGIIVDMLLICFLYGHIAGDRVLKETGALLSSVFGKSNCFRYGGDEFLVICPETSEKNFRIKLDEMMKNKPKTEVDGKSVAIDYSVGIASGTLSETDSLRRLFYLADERMYDDKHRKIYY